MTQLYLSTAVICLTAVLFLESVFPLRAAPVPLRRWLRNLGLSALSLGVTVLSPLLFWLLLRVLRVAPGDGGFAHWNMPTWFEWLATFLLMDAIAYALHRLSHAWPWLWRLHAVHHSDIELDATTTHRHHPLEALVGAFVTLPVLLVLAPPPAAVFAYSLLAVAVSTVSHGNLHLSPVLDRALRPVVVTPAFHRVHHSALRAQTDSNYATVFPLFDYLLRSAGTIPADGGRRLKIGLETQRDAASQSLAAMLLAPFHRGVRRGEGN
jgi:sterol desaturase/sphingolipid hydroxylase (fatty acid hydroxylase superfamily)